MWLMRLIPVVAIMNLIRCGQVSKRIGKIRNIESLWRNVDLSYLGDAYDEFVVVGKNYSQKNCNVKASFIKFLLDKAICLILHDKLHQYM